MENQIIKTKKPRFTIEGMGQGLFFAKEFTKLHKGEKITWDLLTKESY